MPYPTTYQATSKLHVVHLYVYYLRNILIISLELQNVTPTSAIPTNVGTVKTVYYQTANDNDECKYKQR
jgi:hypothetical protein